MFLPLLHALTGSETTPRIFGISKPAVIKLFKKSERFRQRCSTFLAANNSSGIEYLGDSLVSCLYDERCSLTLDALRFQRWCIDGSCIVYIQQLQSVLYLDMCRMWRDVYWFTHCQVSGVYIVGWFKTGRVLSVWVLKIVFLMDTLLFVHG